MSQNPSTSFTNYCEFYVKDINNINKIERGQGQVQALILTNIQDLLTDFCQIYDKIMTIYQKMHNISSVNINPALTNLPSFQVPSPIVLSIFLIDLNCYMMGVKSLKLQQSFKYNRVVEDNDCKKWMKKIQAYIFCYEKCKVFANKKKDRFCPRLS